MHPFVIKMITKHRTISKCKFIDSWVDYSVIMLYNLLMDNKNIVVIIRITLANVEVNNKFRKDGDVWKTRILEILHEYRMSSYGK